jgi:hypothetical protein
MTQINIRTINAVTSVFLINGELDLRVFTEPTLSILQSAFNDGDYEIIPDPEPFVEQPIPDWTRFYKSLKLSATYQYLIGLSVQVPNISGVMAAMGLVIQDGIRDPSDPDVIDAFKASVSGVLYALNAIELPLNSEQLLEVRGLLDANGFNDVQLQ